MSHALETLADPGRATAALHPIRRRLLAALDEPASATALARQLELPRQKVNYHLRTLESEGLVEMAQERRRGNCVERIMRRSARAYVLDPELLADLDPDPEKIADRASSAYLLALASRAVHEVSSLRAGAEAAGKRLATLGLDTRIRFASAADRAAFARRLADAVASLVAEYHDDGAADGHDYRLVAGSYPVPDDAPPPPQETDS